jgi:hypothetical protein
VSTKTYPTTIRRMGAGPATEPTPTLVESRRLINEKVSVDNDGRPWRLRAVQMGLIARSNLEPRRRAVEEVSRISGRTESAETEAFGIAELSIQLSIFSAILGLIEWTGWTSPPS